MKKKNSMVLGMFCIAVLPALAQDTTYYDIGWKVTEAPNASYFRLKTKKDKLWEVRDCFISGKLQMSGYYSDDSCKISQGDFSYFDKNGHLYHSCQYQNGQLDGIDQVYYENNQKRTEGSYKNGKRQGEWVGYYPSGKPSARARYKGGDQVSGKFYNEDGTENKSITEFDRDNEFPGGSPAFQRFLIRNLKYPPSAVDSSIQGTVYIGFNISKEGQILNIRVESSVDPSLDKEALRVLSLMPEWEPRIIGGIFCDSHHVQPVNFKLE